MGTLNFDAFLEKITERLLLAISLFRVTVKIPD
jgi:hypothetical protein